ncbi:MAG: sugar phosphate isomerase/epimerase [Clostridia bacterium]
MNNIRIGTLVGAPDAVRVLPQLIPHGFESFSLTNWKTIEGLDIEETAKKVLEITKPNGVVISTVGIFGNPLVDETCHKAWETLIDTAHLFETDIVSGFAGRIVDRPIEESMPRFKEVFGPLAKRAADKGVRLAFENCDMGGDWAKGDWNIAQNPTAWEMMFNEVPMDNIGLEWEPCHQMVSLIDPLPQLRKWVGKVFHVHGKDATIAWDVIKEFGKDGPKPFVWHRTPGFGDTNWTDLISILRMGGYQGNIDIEGWHDPVYKDELEMTGQVRGLNYLKECRGGSFVKNPD